MSLYHAPKYFHLKTSPEAVAAGFPSSEGWHFKARGTDEGGDWLAIERNEIPVTLRGLIASAWMAQEADSAIAWL